MGKETKIFDPADGFAPFTDVAEITDATIAKRGNRWWMFVACQVAGKEGIQIGSAALPEGTPLGTAGWKPTPDPKEPTRLALLAPHENSYGWDLKGGRHCPSYVKGWDPRSRAWVERIYYAGAADNLWGPYAIGYLEWDGQRWVDRSAPVFSANESWERGSVYEPNLIYHEGKWKMWYVAGSNQQDYLVQCFAESEDGQSNWTRHKIFMPAEWKVFDFSVIESGRGYEAVFSRVWLGADPKPESTGLWWCHAEAPPSDISDWSEPIQIMTAEDRGWHSGPWKPSFRYAENDPNSMFVFFDGIYSTKEPGGFPFAFTLGVLEIQRPERLNGAW